MGLIIKECPKCGQEFAVDEHTIDYVHQCTESNREERLTDDNVPGRVNAKIDKQGWNWLGINPYPHLKSESDLDDETLEEKNWNQYIRLK